MIQINYAGWGSLVGGLVLGCYRFETDAFAAGLIESEFFQNSDRQDPNRFSRKAYLAEAVRVTATCLQQLQPTVDEPLAVSSGYPLTGMHDWLTEAGYTWQIGAANTHLQALLAEELQRHLAELGLHVSLDLLTDPKKAGLLWWVQVRWLKGGDVNRRGVEPERARFCQTGWEHYPTWALHPYREARALVSKRGG